MLGVEILVRQVEVGGGPISETSHYLEAFGKVLLFNQDVDIAHGTRANLRVDVLQQVDALQTHGFNPRLAQGGQDEVGAVKRNEVAGGG